MATAASSDPFSSLRASGAEVLTDAVTLDFFSHDIFARGGDLAAVVRPQDKHQLADAVGAATALGHSVVPRGGGMSYTGGYTPGAAGAILFDLAAMDRILQIDAGNMTVTVEPGCTWASLYEALKPHGLRTPMWGTLSGLKATIGGGMSQNGIFWGSTRHGSAADSCLSLEVVLADGTLMRTGHGNMRSYGPDLTGLFLADTGALGMKAEITLRLIRKAKAHGYASFTLSERPAALGALADIERAGIAAECFGFDPRLNAIRMKRDSMASDAKALTRMMRSQGSLMKGLKEGAKVALAGRDFIDQARFSLHILTEGRIQAAADADIAEARRIVLSHGGSETENTIPKIIRANPFAPLNSVLGPEGERWAPIHGLVPHAKADACYAGIDALFHARRGDMDRLGVHTGTLIAAVAGGMTLIEPCLYWPDARNPLIEDIPERTHVAKLPRHDANAEARAFVGQLKQALVDLFHDHGAAHFQIGRTYRHNDSLDPAARRLLAKVKRAVDPRDLMNPGSLGL